MLIKSPRKLLQLLHKLGRNREVSALNFLVDLGNSDAELRLEIVASLRLPLVV